MPHVDPEFLEYQKLKNSPWNHSTGIIVILGLIVLGAIGGLLIQSDTSNTKPPIFGIVISIAAVVGAIRTKLRFKHLKKKFDP